MDTIVFDTETTGLLKPDSNDLKDQPYITELYAVRLDNDLIEIDNIHFLLKPPIPIPAELVRIIGISNEMVENAPSFLEAYKAIAEFFEGARRMVAHNVGFDSSMLANECLRHDLVLKFPWPMEHYCTVEHSMHIEQRRLTLTRLHEYATGKSEIEGAHRAGNDVAALVKCYQWLMKEGYDE